MGFLRKLKADAYKKQFQKAAKATPEGMICVDGEYYPAFVDRESLPDDFDALWHMSSYYCSIGSRHSEEFEVYKIIVCKMYEMLPTFSQIPDWKKEDIKERYFNEAGPMDVVGSHLFAQLCEAVENRYYAEDPDKSAFSSSFLTGGNLDLVLPYILEHLPELIESICILIEKEKRRDSRLHVGYYMYQDLKAFLSKVNPDKTSDVAWPPKEIPYITILWQKTREYLKQAEIHYLYEPLENTFSTMDQEAIYHVNDCSKEALLAAFRSAAGIGEKASVNSEATLQQLHSDGSEDMWETLYALRRASDSGDLQARKALLEFHAGDKEIRTQVELAKNFYYGNGLPVNKAAAFDLFKRAADAGNGEALFYLGQYYESGQSPAEKDPQKAIDCYERSKEMEFVGAYRYFADREDAGGGDRNLIAEYSKKILPHLSAEKEPIAVKTTLVRIIRGYSTFDIDENTIGLVALAADYVRLDAPIVKEVDLLTLLPQAEQGDQQALDQLIKYYTHYSRPPADYYAIDHGSEIYESDRPRALEMQTIARVFRLMSIANLLVKAKNDPNRYLEDLAQAYLDQGNVRRAKEYVEFGINQNMPDMMYFAYQNARKLDYDEEEAAYYLHRAAALGDIGARGALEYLKMQEESDRRWKDWVETHKPRQESQKDRAADLELLERQIDLMLGGSGSSLDENALMGKLSFSDASLLRHYKNKILEKSNS